MNNIPELDQTWDVWVQGEIPTHRPIIGLPIRLAKRALLKLLGPHDRELLRRQREFNLAARDQLLRAHQRIDALEKELEKWKFPKDITRRYNGVPLKLHIPDQETANWYDYEWGTNHEVNFLKGSRMKPGSTVFDVGAHHCVFALMMAEAVGTEGKVVAVEASPRNVEMANLNKQLNQSQPWVSSLEIVHAAGADKPGTLSFGRGTNGQVDADHAYDDSVTVPAVTVDQLAEKYGTPDVLFIDVEGFECHVLAGARETIRKSRPDIFIEVHRHCGLEQFGGSVEKLLKAIPKGYQLYCSTEHKRELRPFSGPDDSVVADRFFLLAVDRAQQKSRAVSA